MRTAIERVLPLVTLALAVAAVAGPAPVASAHPIVAGFERFFADDEADAVRGGTLLVGELNCTSCHKADGALAGHVIRKQAPVLDHISGRVKPDWLRKFIADPHRVKPGTTMPNLLAGVSDNEKKQQVEALVHFLVSLGPGEPSQDFPNIGAGARGDESFHTLGCMACHGSLRETADPLPTSVPLGNLTSKYTLPGLAGFLQNPHRVRPSGRMPGLNLSGTEARNIAAYLLKGLPEVANVKFSYYEGNWNSVPDFGKLKPTASGGASRIDETLKQRGDHFGLRFEGFLRIDQDGEYTFHLGSDDGSRLLVNGNVIVDVGGIHPYQQKSGKVRLTKGLHPLTVDFFEQGGEERLTAEYQGPGVPRQPIAGAMTTQKESLSKEPLKLEVDQALAARGRRLFTSIGCASCHEVRESGKPLASELAAPDFDKLNSQGGCLAAAPPKGAPNFSLNDRQRQTLSATIASATQSKLPAAGTSAAITHAMTAFNCYACHERDKIGGVEPPRNALFKTTTPEMGDEGRIPPSLTGAGAKLATNYLKSILADGADDRGYMLCRMPKFGGENVGHLTPLFEKADASAEPLAGVKFAEPPNKVKAAGRRLVGAKGLSCIKCHSFGQFKATGIQSIDLRVMAQRLKEDWFRRYMLNPQDYRPGTRMPSAWPPGGKSFLKDVLDGNNDTQIAAVWNYLADGTRAKMPSGLVQGSNELIPIDEAIIYRNFIQGAGPRAIGVGYPEGVNLAFDANGMRLAVIWQGRFIDASRHWSGRGQGFQPPAGENIVQLPGEVTFATLDNAEAAWPNQPAKQLGYRFRGYRLTPDQRPTFLYDFANVAIQDHVDATDEKSPLKRTVTLQATRPVENLWMLAASGAKIEEIADGWFRVDDRWNVQLAQDGAEQPIVRRSGNRSELLLPVKFDNNRAKITQHLDW